MAKNQGFRRLTKGATKKLTNSEVARGYLYISTDKIVKKELGKSFDVVIDKNILQKKKLDKSGRISVGKILTKSLSDKSLTMTLENNMIVIKS